MKTILKKWWLLFAAAATLTGCTAVTEELHSFVNSDQQQAVTVSSAEDIPEYDGNYQETVLNDNKPNFSKADLSLEDVWQDFSDLDHLNRVGIANALIGKESFPTEERSPRLTIKPTGWQQKKLPGGQWLYNRCHLIGFQLTGENDNPKNLMTGTRSFNTPHMLNYENQIMDYIRLTGNHVRYRVTPDFRENELVARGIQLEAKSVEDDDFSFNVYIFNVQDGYTIDYATGSAIKAKK